ncbi:AraC family transcriptional regulator [Aquimarina sp. ERC-38]|uniref:helix-turn-helix domain-containing protein n=1 Tax=Aquimarina sp. ERC-38 TaxID=2949996 RepID=UPI002246EB9F|nr:AraC family transcriptional regulator [Aquimarina sp. ERC-38]UZO82388.1 AraC family transcriptional regulator [Aquimarina sp. ERC-38]
MKLTYQDAVEESSFILTNFNCNPAQQLLQDKGYYKILWAKEKDCSLLVDGYKVHLEHNQVLFSTTLHVLEIPKESGMTAIVFNREFYCIRDHDHEVSCNGMLFFGSSQPPIITLNKKDVKSFEAMFLVFHEEFETRDRIQGEMLRVVLKRLLIKSTRLVKEMKGITEMPGSQMEIMRKFHVLIEEHFREKHQIADYADMLFKSPKTLSNIFYKAGYPSPLAIINERIILEAKRLLLYSEKTAEQISFELGYKEGAHFSKFFKSHCGIPPAAFRAEHKLQQKTVQT